MLFRLSFKWVLWKNVCVLYLQSNESCHEERRLTRRLSLNKGAFYIHSPIDTL